ncbi:protein SSUH2 homolog [Periophthalmus magnuspinnatus]|uniref:protein SSUH2 homolog n=1 Tax=Periophthalmus magnuspinnatus TaxID=409849 RepID=UPI002436EFEF|nr:protein SSUH2 homolog [Periophthalmus magnuspinnatus]
MEKSDHSVNAEADWGRVLRYNNMVLNGQNEFPCSLEPSDDQYETESPPPCTEWSTPSVTKEDALEALRKYVSEHSLDPKPANEAQVTNMEMLLSYRYRLETFTEKRFTCWKTAPYMGEELDASGTPPPPWDIPVEEPTLFRTSSKDIPLPFTSLIKDCARCVGTGRVCCSQCDGGREECYNCHGRGYNFNYYSTYNLREHCYICSGVGHTRCSFCKGMGNSICTVCLQHKKTTVSICLRVKWTNHQKQVLCGEKEPNHLYQLPGRTLMTHTAARVSPVTDFPDPAVVKAAQRMVEKHAREYTKDIRILQQRQSIELVSLCRVSYAWRGQSYQFYVSGKDGDTFVDDYPESTCVCCSVM